MGLEIVHNMQPGRRSVSAYGITYIGGDEDCDATLYEGVEMLLDKEESIVFYNATDWTLKITTGAFPVLPSWCWPPEAWGYEKIERIGTVGMDLITQCEEVYDEVGDFVGVVLTFPLGSMKIRSGDSTVWHIST